MNLAFVNVGLSGAAIALSGLPIERQGCASRHCRSPGRFFVRILFTRRFASRGRATLVDQIGVNTQRNQNIGVKSTKGYCELGFVSQRNGFNLVIIP
jgi:hypothetical protein